MVELADSGLDFGAVSDDDPDEIVGADGRFRGVGYRRHTERADFARKGLVVVVGQAELHLLQNRTSDFVDGFARAGEFQRHGVLGTLELRGGRRTGADDGMELLIQLVERLFRLVGLDGRVCQEGLLAAGAE